MKRLSITTLAALGMLIGTVPLARAADATCGPGIQTISNTTIAGDLVVTGVCFLESGVTVGGDVTVESRAVLNIGPTSSPVKIGGNILSSPGCLAVLINVSSASAPVTIGGNVDIEGCTALDASGYAAAVGLLKIGGNFTCNDNLGGCGAQAGSVGGNVEMNGNNNFTVATSNKVGSNLQGDNNAGATVIGNKVGANGEVDGNGSSASSATGNTIGGNLTCTGNATGFTGKPNTVHGQFLPTSTSQCSAM
jgi:hypothetical protein